MQNYLDKIASLTPDAKEILCHSVTEAPRSVPYREEQDLGSFLCRRCGLALFRGDAHFDSGCGWPAFDAIIPSTVEHRPDPDGRRTEIRCARCHGHLGHVFEGEGFTAKNRRYCVNSLALDFVANPLVLDSEEVIVAGGCFWGVEYYLSQFPHVLAAEVGYIGGHIQNPSYEEVCTGQTGHYEAVRVLYDRHQTDTKAVLQHFFEIHDPTQTTGQGPDLGPQYKSAVFYYNKKQKEVASSLITRLAEQGDAVATKLLPVDVFWPAETYHQRYYQKQKHTPYCHYFVKRFNV